MHKSSSLLNKKLKGIFHLQTQYFSRVLCAICIVRNINSRWSHPCDVRAWSSCCNASTQRVSWLTGSGSLASSQCKAMAGFLADDSEIMTDEPCHGRHDGVGRLEEHLMVTVQIKTGIMCCRQIRQWHWHCKKSDPHNLRRERELGSTCATTDVLV
jgi:hypothetical protein